MAPRPRPFHLIRLLIDPREPNWALFDFKPIHLRPKTYALLCFLARSPMRVVPYADIYTAVWGTNIVEEAQIYYQLNQLRSALSRAGFRPEEWLLTTPKIGIKLMLHSNQIVALEDIPHAA